MKINIRIPCSVMTALDVLISGLRTSVKNCACIFWLLFAFNKNRKHYYTFRKAFFYLDSYLNIKVNAHPLNNNSDIGKINGHR